MEERKAEKKAALEFRCIAQAEASGEVVDPFREVAARWFEKWRVGKVERYARDTEMRLREDVLSRIGDRPIAVIKPLRGLSPSRPASPSASYRFRHSSTVGTELDSLRAMARLATPCAAANTISTRRSTPRGVLR
jgi:hypothetical protein